MNPFTTVQRDWQGGFSIVETIVATGILAVAIASLGQLFALSAASNRGARYSTYATLLASQKMEQLRGLTLGFDALSFALTDTSTDTTVDPQAAGGTGLSASPAGTIGASTNGYVDYLDATGRVLGGGASLPRGTAYIRRWSIEPLPADPNNTLVLQVLVTRVRHRGPADEGRVGRMPEEARLTSVKTRKAM